MLDSSDEVVNYFDRRNFRFLVTEVLFSNNLSLLVYVSVLRSEAAAAAAAAAEGCVCNADHDTEFLSLF